MAYIHGGSILRHYASSLHGLPHSILTEVPLIRYHDGKPSPVFLPGKSQGQRSLAGYSPWGHKSWTRLKQQYIAQWAYGGEE